MKKKLMMVAVLLGALTLGACVDDNESQSVTDVRSAKAEQLKAMAALDKASAEAALIMANAEKAYKEAQAAYEKAQAEVLTAKAQAEKAYLEAQTEALKAQTEIEKAAAEALLAERRVQLERAEFQLKKDKEAYERDLERIKAQAELDLLIVKIQLANKEQEFLALADAQLKQLYRTYSYEVSVLDGLKSELNTANSNLVNYEKQSITQEDFIAKETAKYEGYISQAQAKIEVYKAYTGKDRSELEIELTKLELEKNNAYMDYLQAQQAMAAPREAYYKVIDAFNVYNTVTLKTLLAAQTLSDLGYHSLYNQEFFIINEEHSLDVPKYVLTQRGEYVVNARQTLNGRKTYAKNRLGAPKAGETAATGLYANLERANADLKAAQDAEDQAAIENATYWVAYWNSEIAAAKDELAAATKNVDAFEAAIASFAGNDLTAYNNALNALKTNETVVAYINALKTKEAAEKAHAELQNKYNAVYNLFNSSVDAKERIRNLESDIASWKVYIATLTNNFEIFLQQTKDRIANLKTQITLQEAVVDIAKKNLDAAIAESK